MGEFRKRSSYVQAVQWLGEKSLKEVKEICPKACVPKHEIRDGDKVIYTDHLEVPVIGGVVKCALNSWVVKDLFGDFTVWSSNLFSREFESSEAPTDDK